MADASESMPTTESGTREERPRWQDQPRPWKESTSTLGLLVKVAVFVLPPALYIAGFVLTLKTIESPNFVRADQLTSPPPGSPVQFTNHTLHSSLWHTCISKTNNGVFIETCVRRPAYGAAGLAACEAETTFNPFSRICQKVVSAAELYLAAAVLGGIAMVAALVLSLLEMPSCWGCRSEGEALGGVVTVDSEQQTAPMLQAPQGTIGWRRRPRRGGFGRWNGQNARILIGLLATLTHGIAIAAGGCLFAGQILGVDALVVEGSVPFANDFVSEEQTRWYLSTGALQLTTAAYVLILSGAFIAGTRCGLPAPGTVSTLSRRSREWPEVDIFIAER
ncbi:hypothetical protein Trisim1_000810 [Trichoderma cf. simile WF8]